MQRIVPALAIATLGLLLGGSARLGLFFPGAVAQSPFLIEQAEIQPVLPPGISDFNLELYGKLASTWTAPDQWRVVQIEGNFSARMGPYKLSSRDAVLWFRQAEWQQQGYLEVQVFLWQDAEVVQPAGTFESGPALLVTLRTFGKLILNADAHAAVPDSDGPLYREASTARQLLSVAPPPDPKTAKDPIAVAPDAEQLMRLAVQKPPKLIQFSVSREDGEVIYEIIDEQAVVIAVNEVMISQGAPSESGDYLELRADAAVIYLNREQVGDALPGMIGGDDRSTQRGRTTQPTTQAAEGGAPRLDDRRPDTPRGQTQAAAQWASAVYLEGDVILTRGHRMIRAPRLYYDFESDRALILDVVTRAAEPSRNIPVYVRAAEIRQLSANEYEARQAQFTTSEFHTPHVSIGADRVILTDRTPRNEAGDIIGVQAGTYKAYHTTLNLEGLPIAYWPFSQGDFSRDRMAFRDAKFGYNNNLGTTIETQWYLFNLLGLEQPAGYDATLKLDYLLERGPGVGIDMDYERENYYGLLRSYYLHDDGKDKLRGQRGTIAPDTEDRGRILWRHRQFLPKGWELTLEAAYISDDQYLEFFERSEFENAKDQETLIYLLKRQDNWQFSTLTNWRINEFLTQTEHLPDNVFSLIGEPLGDYATLYSESRAGVVRYRPDERRIFNGQNRRDNTGETGAVLRADTRDELQFPLPNLGPIKLTPFIAGRASAYDDGPSGMRGADRFSLGEARLGRNTSDGGFGRVYGSYGIRGNTLLSRTDDSIESELLDLHRLRHIIKPDFTLWNAHANRHPYQMTPFDSGIEDIDDFGGGAVGLRQKFQTQRGGPGNWRTVDWIVFDVEAGFFSNKENSQPVENYVWGKRSWEKIPAYVPPVRSNSSHGDFIASRPEDSISSNFLATNFQYRLSDSTVVVHDSVYDWNRGNMGTQNLTLAVERQPRLSYFVGWRYIHDIESNLLALGGNYKLSEKHIVGARELYDIEEGRNFSTEFVYIRRWPRWYTAIAVDIDRSIDNLGVNFSVWPEGAPRVGLGSKRYTGLADSVGLQLR